MHVVVGCNGPVGVATMFELRARGLEVRGASRSGRSEAHKRRVFADNLYTYGPQTRPLTEDMPFTELGRKPARRARLDRDMPHSL